MECRIRIAIKTMPIHNTDYGTVISPWYLKEIESGLGCGEFGLNHPVLTARRDLSNKKTNTELGTQNTMEPAFLYWLLNCDETDGTATKLSITQRLCYLT